MPRTLSSLGLERRRWTILAVAAALLFSGIFIVSANAATLEIQTTALHDGAVGQPYVAPSTLTATGGSSPYSWSLSGGSLPTGLSLAEATGVISGTPTILANSALIVKVTDSNGNVATKPLAIKVNPPVVVQTAAVPPAPASSAYPSTQLVATGGTGAPYTWSVVGGTLSPLALSAGGQITGTTPAASTLNFTVQATDSAGHSDQQALSILVTPAGALIITTPSLPNGVDDLAYPSTALTASGGVLPLTWTIDAGSLPAGIGISAAGVLTGAPTTPGTVNFTVKVTDSTAGTPLTNTKPLTINVMAAIDITTGSPLPVAKAGIPYSTLLAASGGTPPYTWAASPPFGLSMSATTGAITGTPTSSGGPTVFSVQVTDFHGYQKSEDFSLTSDPATAPNITTTTLPNAIASTDYTQQIFKTDGTAADTWSLSGAPAGLTITSTGLLTWTPAPATLGSHTFSVQVTGSAGSDTQSLTLTIGGAGTLAITTNSPLPAATVNVAYSQGLSRSGGVAPFTWSTVSGLPSNGFSLSSSGVVSGTPTATGTTTFTVRVTDSASPQASVDKQFSITVNSTTPTPGTGTGEFYGPCRAFYGGANGQDSGRLTSFRKLIDAAGATAQVRAFCDANGQKVSDDDDEFRRMCSKLFSSSDSWRSRGGKEAGMRRLIEAAGAAENVRSFCISNFGTFSGREFDDDDDDYGHSHGHEKNKGWFGGKGHKN